MHDFLVTLAARLIGNFQILRLNLQRLVKAARGERERMPKAIRSLGRILAGESGRRMTVVADGHSVVARFDPGAVMIPHDVTVSACRRVIRQVGTSSSIDERVGANPGGQSYQERGNDRDSQWLTSLLIVAEKWPEND